MGLSKFFKWKYVIGIFFIILFFLSFDKEEEIIIKQPNENINDTIDSQVEEIYIDVKGAVVNPGLYKMQEGDRVNDAIEVAGGYANANENCLNLSEKVMDQDLLYVPKSDEECDNSAINNGVVDINKANEFELQSISGIGETRAKSIIDYREENGYFNSKEDLKNVDGIGQSTYESIEDQIKV